VQSGFPVRAIRRSLKIPSFIANEIWEKVEWIESDILDVVGLEEAMQDCFAVIHAAAIVSFNSHDRHLMNEVNIEGTKNVINTAIENNIQRFIHISSVAALGRTEAKQMVSEEKKWEETSSNTHYSITKHYAELEVWRGFSEGLNGVILNPSTILGFGDWNQSSCAIFKNAYKGFPWFTEGINGFVSVEDTAECVVKMLQSEITEKRFIVNADNWSFQQLFNTMADGFGKKKPHRKATPFLGEIAWRLEGLKHLFADGKPLLTKESARVAHSKTSFDNSSILEALPGFTFKPLEKVINASCKKYKQAIEMGLLSL
jgi:nucleoside-diphosphate-sugar epimerase